MASRGAKTLAYLMAAMVLGPCTWTAVKPWVPSVAAFWQDPTAESAADVAVLDMPAKPDLPLAAEGEPAAWSELSPENAPAHKVPAQVATPVAPMPSVDRELMLLIQAKFNVGDYHSALQLAEQHLNDASRSPVFSAWLAEQLPVMLVSSGWLHIKTGDCEQAVSKLAQANEQRRIPEAASGLAFCYHKLQQWTKAEAEINWYLEGRGKEAQAWLLYSEIQESLLDYGKALQGLEQAVKWSPQPQQDLLKKRLQTMRYKSQKSQDQQTIDSRHFSLTVPLQSPPEFGDSVLTLLEESLNEFVEGYRARVGNGKFEVLLYSSEDFGQVVSGVPHWAAGIYDGRIRIPLGGWDDSSEHWQRLRHTLRHELVHAILAEMTDRRRLPTWFDEGVADHFAHSARLAGGFPFSPVPGRFLTPQDFTDSFTKLDKIKAEQAYRQSLYLVLTLERRIDRTALGQIIEALSPQLPLDSASLLAPLALNFPSLVEKSQQYWQKRDMLSW